MDHQNAFRFKVYRGQSVTYRIQDGESMLLKLIKVLLPLGVLVQALFECKGLEPKTLMPGVAAASGLWQKPS